MSKRISQTEEPTADLDELQHLIEDLGDANEQIVYLTSDLQTAVNSQSNDASLNEAYPLPQSEGEEEPLARAATKAKFSSAVKGGLLGVRRLTAQTVPRRGDKYSHRDFGSLAYESTAGDPANTTLAYFRDSKGKPITIKFTDPKLKRVGQNRFVFSQAEYEDACENSGMKFHPDEVDESKIGTTVRRGNGWEIKKLSYSEKRQFGFEGGVWPNFILVENGVILEYGKTVEELVSKLKE